MIGIILGVLAIILGAKAFTPSGLPLTRNKNLLGTPAKITGIICIILGATFIVDGVFATFGMWQLFSGEQRGSLRTGVSADKLVLPHASQPPRTFGTPGLQPDAERLQDPASRSSRASFEGNLANAPPDDDQCLHLAKAIDAALTARDANGLAQLFDWDAFCDRSVAYVDGSGQSNPQVLANLRRSLPSAVHVSQQLFRQAAEGRFRLLRISDHNGDRCALFRLLLPQDQGVNYFKFILAKRPGNEPKVVDAYVMSTGEMLSVQIAQGLVSLGNSSDGEVRAIEQMAGFLRSGQFDRAIGTYQALPETSRRNKLLLRLRLIAAKSVSENEYLAAIEAFRAYYPRDPSLNLLLIDCYRLRKQYQQALSCIESLDSALGGDPYLDTMRAGILSDREDYALAKEAAHRAVDMEPGLEPPYWILLRISLVEKDFAETGRLLNLMQESLGVTPTDLTSVEEFSEFVKSPEYRKWRKSAGQLGERPPVPSEPAEPPAEHETTGDPAWDVLGLELEPISGEELRNWFSTRYKGGLKVTAVRPQSPADGQGIREGDVLVGLHIWETLSRDNVKYILSRSDFHKLNPVKFFILRTE